jgi:4-amino-4-deoxy-L-arabinose transferase-like glycosyltransferase
MGCAYFAILAIRQDNPRHWLWFGVCAGIGLENKYTIAIFGLGIVVGLLLTEQRRVLLSKWIWLGGLAAFLIFLPNLLWNIHYDWPFVQLMHAIRADGRDVVWGPLNSSFSRCSSPILWSRHSGWADGSPCYSPRGPAIGCWVELLRLPTPSCFYFMGRITIWLRFTRCCCSRSGGA